MTRVRRLLLLWVATVAVGCGSDSGKVTKPGEFAPPPSKNDPGLKGDTLPGPP